ncbi:MAG: hypothetical protein ACT4NU_05275 [Chromatiales bacterium]
MLTLDAGNADAQAGLEGVERALVETIDAAIGAGELETTDERLEELRRYAPDARDIPDLAQRVEEARNQQRQEAEVNALLSAAQADMDAGRVISPPGDNAPEKYRKLDTLRPRTGAVRQAFIDIGNHLMTLANKASADGGFEEVYGYLDTAKSTLPDRKEIDEARDFVGLRRTWDEQEQRRAQIQ